MDLGMAVKATAWCTDSAYAAWNCNCDLFDTATGLGQVTDCRYEQDCGKCNLPSSCLQVLVSINVEEEYYDYQLCRFYDSWSVCMQETVEWNGAGNIVEHSCVFTAGGSDFCCTSSKDAECGVAFCAEESLTLDMCQVLGATCPRLELKPPSAAATAATQAGTVFTSRALEPFPSTGNETILSPTSPPSFLGTDELFMTAMNTTIDMQSDSFVNGTIEVDWQVEFCSGNGTAGGLPEVCGLFNTSEENWFSLVGNGDYLRFIPSCSDDLGNVTVAVVEGSCDSGLVCVKEPEVFNISCDSLSIRQRLLNPSDFVLGPLDFLTFEGVSYYIYWSGLDDLFLNYEIPFEIVSLGPGPAPTDPSTLSPTQGDDSDLMSQQPSAAPVPTVEKDKSEALQRYQPTYLCSLLLFGMSIYCNLLK